MQDTTFTGMGRSGDPSGPGKGKGPAPQFDIFEWYPRYQSCQKYFLDHSQHSVPVRALAAFVNILLPCQRHPNPIVNSSALASPSPGQIPQSQAFPFPPGSPKALPTPFVSLIPYIRRLVATGMDMPGVLHGFFGDDWVAGVGSLHEQERRNYLFAAKSGGWESVKKEYDMSPLETAPFLRPLQGTTQVEIEAAEQSWSDWLYHEDWMIGKRPEGSESHRGQREG